MPGCVLYETDDYSIHSCCCVVIDWLCQKHGRVVGLNVGFNVRHMPFSGALYVRQMVGCCVGLNGLCQADGW